ncbi:MAG: hypothetical protein LBF58_09340 [Deltaproteobacteria bacterium]|jgi:hypothetical protein|nr:hypothetical protein [Deltaproteobacteria bacterium]
MKPFRSKGFTIVYPGTAITIRSLVRIGFVRDNKDFQLPPFEDKFLACWDTGATKSCIKESIAKHYNLPSIGEIICRGINSENKVKVYLASIFLPNETVINEIELCSHDDTLNIDLLIGMDIISMGELLVSTSDGITAFSFQSPAATVLTLNSIPLRPKVSFEINQSFNPDMLCPCGSEKIFNKCCGKR